MALIRLTEVQVTALVEELKPIPPNFETRMRLRQKTGHKERDFDTETASGNRFSIIVRQADANPLDFSVILAYHLPTSNDVIRLRRYNGKSHEHTNSIEKQTFYDFHIHMATERYQKLGSKAETFAEVTTRYNDVTSAMECLRQDCNLQVITSLDDPDTVNF